MIFQRLDKRLQLQKKIKTPDDQGGNSFVWTTVSSVWAEFRKINAKSVEMTGTVVSDMTREIGIRYRSDVRKGWRAVWGDRVFDIVHTYEYGRDATILVCREVIK